MQRLEQYKQAIVKYKKSSVTHHPDIHKPTRAEFNIKGVAETFVAERIEKELAWVREGSG